ncbi:cell wall-binding repeat-containing protein [Leifsonia sp. NPDC058292]|uniref:cell wall-binding repeat-containing protein n=1 Tax=Leifsonia sp. NPDC058292 TaxID=3346428 RepID=UPI0036DAE4FC
MNSLWRAVLGAGLAGGLVVGMLAPTAVASTPIAWSQFGNGPTHTGVNASESAISRSTVASLKPAFTAKLPGVADGPPVLLPAVATGAGMKDLLFSTTKDGWIAAIDARTGATVWTHQNGPGSCKINNGTQACYTTSSPAIDPAGHFVYSYGLDGRVHKYAVGTGAEVVDASWPELATAKPYDEKSSPALTIATVGGVSYLYVSNGGYPGDRGDYQGHVTTINLNTGAQKVFNTLCSDKSIHFTASPATDCGHVQSAVWARPSVNYDPATNRVYFATGNALFDGAHNWGDTVLAIKPDGSGVSGGPVDSYTPSNQATLNSADLDLGSTSPAIVTAPAGSAVKNLGVQSGKDAKLRLLDLANLSGQGAPGKLGGELQLMDVPQGGQVLTQPAAWVNPANGVSWVFVANNSGISALTLTVGGGGKPHLATAWKSASGGTTPIIAGGMLVYLTNNGARALDPTTGAVLWSDTSGTVGLHWQSPIVANGYLYYADGAGNIRAFNVPASAHPLTRVAGVDRYATSAAVSAAAFVPGAPIAYVASGLDFADALSGTPAAAAGHGPLLLVQPTAIPASVASELTRLRPRGIVVLGGTGAVSASVEQSLRAYTAGSVTRVSGADRFATSAAVSARTPARSPVAYVASGVDFPDALSGGALAAGANSGPLLLVRPGDIAAVTATELTRLQPGRIVVFGGDGAVSESVLQSLRAYTAGTVTRLSGVDRYATSAAISATFAASPAAAYVVTGTEFPDALAAAAAAGVGRAPLLLVMPGSIPPAIAGELSRLKPRSLVVVGGTGAVSDPVEAALRAYVP